MKNNMNICDYRNINMNINECEDYGSADWIKS